MGKKTLIITCYQYVHILFVIIKKRTFQGHHFRLEVAQVVDPPLEEANLEVVYAIYVTGQALISSSLQIQLFAFGQAVFGRCFKTECPQGF